MSLKMQIKKALARELDTWLALHPTWDHEAWQELIAHLRVKGLGELTLSEEGRTVIGRYLEERREAGR